MTIDRTMTPELKEMLGDAIERAYRGGRRDDGMSVVDYAVQLLAPIIASVDENAHNRGLMLMANRVDAMFSDFAAPLLSICPSPTTCSCSLGDVYRAVRANRGVIQP